MEREKIKTIRLLGVLLLVMLLSAGAGVVYAQPAPAEKEEAAEVTTSEKSALKISYAFQLYGQSRDTGSGPDGTSGTDDMFFKRNRLMLSGQLDDVYGFYAAIQHIGDQRIYGTSVSDTPRKSLEMLDTYFTADYADAFKLRAGLMKDQLVRESLDGCFDPLSADRSLFVYTNVPRVNRDLGILLWGNLANDMVQYRLAAMKGNDSGDDPQSSFRYTGRLHVSLLDPETANAYRSTYLGQKKVLTLGAGYQSEENALYGDLANKEQKKNYSAITYDAFFEYPMPAGTVTLSGAYLETRFDNAYKGADPDPRSIGLNGEKNGWYAKAGYLLPGTVGAGKLQFFGRVEEWKFALLSGVHDQTINWSAYGLNYLVKGQNLRFTLEYSMNDYEKEDAANKDFKTITAMLQFRI